MGTEWKIIIDPEMFEAKRTEGPEYLLLEPEDLDMKPDDISTDEDKWTITEPN